MRLKHKKFFFIFFALFFNFRCLAKDLTVWDHSKSTISDSFDRTGLWILGVGSALTLVAFHFDQQTHDNWKDHQQISAGLSQYGDYWGSGVPEVLILAGQTYFDRENGIPGLEGLILGGIVTHAAKIAIGRERPDSSTKTAMPSGHTQAAFSIAASMTESYGWKVGLPFWCMGAFTGMTRLADNAHWLSDVMAGATIGALFGRAGYRHHRQFQPLVFLNRGQVEGAGLTLNMEW